MMINLTYDQTIAMVKYFGFLSDTCSVEGYIDTDKNKFYACDIQGAEEAVLPNGYDLSFHTRECIDGNIWEVCRFFSNHKKDASRIVSECITKGQSSGWYSSNWKATLAELKPYLDSFDIVLVDKIKGKFISTD